MKTPHDYAMIDGGCGLFFHLVEYSDYKSDQDILFITVICLITEIICNLLKGELS